MSYVCPCCKNLTFDEGPPGTFQVVPSVDGRMTRYNIVTQHMRAVQIPLALSRPKLTSAL